jgi:hypothetical protein
MTIQVIRRSLIVLSVVCVTSAIHAQKADPYQSLYYKFKAKYSNGMSSPEYWALREKASAKNADAKIKFELGVALISGYDKGYLSKSRVHGFMKQADTVFGPSDLKLSPWFGFVIAALSRDGGFIGKYSLQGAKDFHVYRNDGISAQLLCRMMHHSSDLKVRAAAYPYALQAKKSMPDSLSIRWLVAGSSYYVADLSKKKSDWQVAIDAYENARELAKTKDDINILDHFINLAKEGRSKAKT